MTDTILKINDFSYVRQRHDRYYNTQQTLSLYRSFVKEELPGQFDVSKADQAVLLNKSVRFFKEKDDFTISDSTVKKQSRTDKNGKFYKIYYKEEN